MKKVNLILVREFLITQMNHWVLFMMAVTILGLSGNEKPDIIRWCLLSIFPGLLYLIRRKLSKVLPFTISHTALAVIMWFLLKSSNMTAAVLFTLCLVFYLVNSVYIKVCSDNDMNRPLPPAVAVAIGALALFIQHSQGHQDWDIYYMIPLVVFLCFYYLCYYMEKYLYFVRVNESSTGHMPKAEIFRSGIGLTTIFTLFGAAVFLMAANVEWFSVILAKIREALYALLKMLSTGASVLEEVPWAEAAVDESGFMELQEYAQSHWIWEVLGKVFLVMMTGILLFLLLLCIYRIIKVLVRFLKEGFDKKKIPAENKTEAVVDIREKIVISKSKKERKSRFGFLTAQEKIRRIYQKAVVRRKSDMAAGDVIFPGIFTARELDEMMDLGELTGLYEKARYSHYECTKEDVKEAKQYFDKRRV